MKTKQLLISLTLGLGLTLGLLWLLGGTKLPAAHAAASQCPNQRPLLQAGDVITVCLSGGCDYTSIQDAVDAAVPGDEIRVATGTYTGVSARAGVTQVVYISKTVTIRGGYTTAFTDPPEPEANHTTLDAQGQGRVLYITGDISPTIEGLSITGGDAAGLGGGRFGCIDTCHAGGGFSRIQPTMVVDCSFDPATLRSAATLSPPTPRFSGVVGCSYNLAPHSAETPSQPTLLCAAVGEFYTSAILHSMGTP